MLIAAAMPMEHVAKLHHIAEKWTKVNAFDYNHYHSNMHNKDYKNKVTLIKESIKMFFSYMVYFNSRFSFTFRSAPALIK